MEILVTGASGMVGSALVPVLRNHGRQVTRLVRHTVRPETQEIFWDPSAGRLEAAALARFDAVIHLAGENIGAGRWNAERKRRILESRVNTTRLLSRALASLERPPRVLICASAVGYYGNRGDEVVTEDSKPGTGFLAEVCMQWEEAAAAATRPETRLVSLRMGIILAREGGTLARMLPPFRLGIGGKLGSGKQYMSWISLDDLLEIILFALDNPSLHGAVNAVAPAPVTNRDFTRALGRVLHRPVIFPIPAPMLRLMFGEMGDQLLLASTRAVPARLSSAGFRFRFPDLEPALRHVL